MRHQLDDELILLGSLCHTTLAIEILLIIDADVGDERLGEADGDTARHTMALVVVHLQCAWRIIGGIIASAIAVVAHEVVTSQWGNLLHQRLLRHDRDVVAYEAIEGVDIVEGILGVMLVEVLSLGDETSTMERQACVIHRDRDIGWLDLLRAQHEVDVREEELRLGGIVDALGPVVLLMGQA